MAQMGSLHPVCLQLGAAYQGKLFTKGSNMWVAAAAVLTLVASVSTLVYLNVALQLYCCKLYVATCCQAPLLQFTAWP